MCMWSKIIISSEIYLDLKIDEKRTPYPITPYQAQWFVETQIHPVWPLCLRALFIIIITIILSPSLSLVRVAKTRLSDTAYSAHGTEWVCDLHGTATQRLQYVYCVIPGNTIEFEWMICCVNINLFPFSVLQNLISLKPQLHYATARCRMETIFLRVHHQRHNKCEAASSCRAKYLPEKISEFRLQKIDFKMTLHRSFSLETNLWRNSPRMFPVNTRKPVTNGAPETCAP